MNAVHGGWSLLTYGVGIDSSLSWGQLTVVVLIQADLQVEQTRQHIYELSGICVQAPGDPRKKEV